MDEILVRIGRRTKKFVTASQQSQCVSHFSISTPKKNGGDRGVNKTRVQMIQPDTNHLDKQMTKDTTDTSQLSQSSQHPRQDPTKLQKDLSRRRTRHRPEHQMFFLLVFLKDKFI